MPQPCDRDCKPTTVGFLLAGSLRVHWSGLDNGSASLHTPVSGDNRDRAPVTPTDRGDDMPLRAWSVAVATRTTDGGDRQSPTTRYRNNPLSLPSEGHWNETTVGSAKKSFARPGKNTSQRVFPDSRPVRPLLCSRLALERYVADRSPVPVTPYRPVGALHRGAAGLQPGKYSYRSVPADMGGGLAAGAFQGSSPVIGKIPGTQRRVTACRYRLLQGIARGCHPPRGFG